MCALPIFDDGEAATDFGGVALVDDDRDGLVITLRAKDWSVFHGRGEKVAFIIACFRGFRKVRAVCGSFFFELAVCSFVRRLSDG